jgi:hypothetical protein
MVLFNTLTYISRTNSLIESENNANKQISIFENEMVRISEIMKNLEIDLISNKSIIQLIEKVGKVSKVKIIVCVNLFYFFVYLCCRVKSHLMQ